MEATTQHIHQRYMIKRDLPEVLAIEAESFPLGAWSERDFVTKLTERRVLGWVAEIPVESASGFAVAGFLVYELQPTAIELVNLAVHPAFRRRGIARQLVERQVRKLSLHRRTLLTVTVRESNLAAQLFFRACGLRAARTVRRFYEDTGETAYVMELQCAG